jgi:general stress protein 26
MGALVKLQTATARERDANLPQSWHRAAIESLVNTRTQAQQALENLVTQLDAVQARMLLMHFVMADQPNQARSRGSEDDTTKTPQDIVSLARSFDTAMFVTHGNDGGSRARPMSVAQVEDDASVWFVTSATNDLVAELKRDPRALIVMQGRMAYLCIEGRATTHHDRAKIAQLWSEPMRVWFTDENDPNILLVEFRPNAAEYWDMAGTQGIKLAFRAAKAALTGEPMRKDQANENHGKVRL